MEAIGAISGLITVVEVSVRITAICLKYSKGVKNAGADIQRLQKTIQHLRHTSESVLELLRGPDQWRLRASQKLLQATEDSEERLKSLEEKLQPSSTRGKFMRLGLSSFKWPFEKKDMERLVTELSQCSQAISAALQVDQLEISLQTSHDIIKIDRTIQEMDKRTLLDRLPVVHDAAFDSQAEEHNALCLPETRVDNIHQILEWVSDPQSPSLFWLKGMAGTGKSTISRTIAHSLDARGMLGASFFFKRVEGDRSGISKLFATLAFQLSVHDGQVAKQLISVLDKNPSIPTKASKDQFEKMILEPLRLSYPPDSKAVIVIILDALDECSNHNDARNVINLFSKARVFGIRLRVLITSRPELLLRLGFNEANCDYQSMDLSDTPEITVQQDIARYFETELARIRTEYNARVADDRRLTEDWPGERHAQDLIEMAIPLFIFAATVCRFLAEIRWEPDEQLVKVLNYQSQNPVSKLDATYAPVLNQLIDGLSESEIVEVVSDFQQIVGVIIILEDSLSTSVLSQLLDIPRRKIDRCLDMLYSVLSVPASSTLPVRLLHTSFRDYLLDPKMKDTNRFWIDKVVVHRKLSNRCLEKMNSTLHEDMCELRAPGIFRKSVEQTKIDDSIDSATQYACKYWVTHTVEVTVNRSVAEQAYEFLKAHFLHWLEVLSLLGELPRASAAIDRLQVHMFSSNHVDLGNFLSDSLSFIRRFFETADIAPLQLYSSALLFSPTDSPVRQANKIPDWVTLAPLTARDWDPYLLLLEGHKRSVEMAIVSPDSQYIAACTSGKEIWVWSTDYGVFKAKLEGHTRKVISIAFTADSTRIASYSEDNTVRLWDLNEVKCLKIHCFAFSSKIATPHPVVVLQEGGIVARTQHEDGSFHIWQVETGQIIRKIDTGGKEIAMMDNKSNLYATVASEMSLQFHTMDSQDIPWQCTMDQSITNGTISADSSLIAIVCSNSIQIWKRNTGSLYRTLDGHTMPISKINFSPDLRLLASGAEYGTICIWNIENGECLRTLCCTSALITSLEFSSDSSLIVVGCGDQVIRVLKTSLHSNATPLLSDRQELNTSIFGVNTAKNVVMACTTPRYATHGLHTKIQLWSLSSGEQLKSFVADNDAILAAGAYSHDCENLLLAVAYESLKVRVWSVSSGMCVCEFKCDDKIYDLTISGDSTTVVCSVQGSGLEFYDTTTGHCFLKSETSQSYHRMHWQRDGQIHACPDPWSMHIIDGSTGELLENTAVSKVGTDVKVDEARRWITWRGERLLHVPLSYYSTMGSLITRVQDDILSCCLPCEENGGMLVFALSVSRLVELHGHIK